MNKHRFNLTKTTLVISLLISFSSETFASLPTTLIRSCYDGDTCTTIDDEKIRFSGIDTPELKHRWDYIYEPDAKELLDGLMQRYIESLVYQAVIENIACEQAAKMIAMKNATENAGTLIDELQLIYNNARQAAITQELSEIVGGAAAL